MIYSGILFFKPGTNSKSSKNIKERCLLTFYVMRAIIWRYQCMALERLSTQSADNFVHHLKRNKIIHVSGNLGRVWFVIGNLNWMSTAKYKSSIINRKLARFESQYLVVILHELHIGYCTEVDFCQLLSILSLTESEMRSGTLYCCLKALLVSICFLLLNVNRVTSYFESKCSEERFSRNCPAVSTCQRKCVRVSWLPRRPYVFKRGNSTIEGFLDGKLLIFISAQFSLLWFVPLLFCTKVQVPSKGLIWVSYCSAVFTIY